MKYLSLCLAFMLAIGCGSSNVAREQKYVNIGYGEVPQDNLTTAVSSVDMGQLERGVYNTIYDYLEGRVPGLQIIKNNGGKPSILIRGINSINSSTEPLILVDGVEVQDISYLNPRDVRSVDVLKDASAAIYGSRGGNGVILITLKK